MQVRYRRANLLGCMKLAIFKISQLQIDDTLHIIALKVDYHDSELKIAPLKCHTI